EGGERRHGPGVEGELAPRNRGVRVDVVGADARDRGGRVREVRLVARHGDVVTRAVAATHQAEITDRIGDLGLPGRDQPTLPGGDVLRRVQRETGHVADRADLPSAIAGLQRMRRVFDHRYAE